jgi:hypothetical protein
VDDILLRRSNSLRQGLTAVGSARRKSSLEDLGISFGGASHPSNHSNAIKIALNGSIGLEVTPPDEGSTPSGSSSSGMLNSGMVALTIGVGGDSNANGGTSGNGVGVAGDSGACGGGLDVSVLGGFGSENCLSAGQVSTVAQGTVTDPQHLQGTLV